MKGCLKWGLIAFGAFILLCLVATLTDSGESTSGGTTDSIKVEQTEQEEEKTINTDSIVNAMRAEYVFKKDEFDNEGRTWVQPKSKPKYRNNNAFYCYFQMNENVASNFRFVMQYYDSSWLFIENCIFNIDGENYTYVPQEMKRDNNSSIWEWFDDSVTLDNVALIRKIAQAKAVKVKLNGSQYSNTRTMKDTEIASIAHTLKYYEELGGQFD